MYISPRNIIEALLDTANRAAVESGAEHAEDLGIAMVAAIENAWPAIAYIQKNSL